MIVGCCVNDPVDFPKITTELESKWPRVCIQMFLRQPTAYKDVCSAEQLDEIARWTHDECASSSTHVLVIHAAYVSHPWKGARSSLYNLGLEEALCRRVGAYGLILHLDPGVRNRIHLETVLSRLAGFPSILFFEINAVKASGTSFHTPQLLAAAFDLIWEVAAEHNLQVGLCIDTAHLFASGVSMRDYDFTKEWLDEAAKLMPAIPFMFHLNDSHEQCGSGRDKHAGLMQGNIWRDSARPCGIDAIVEFAESHRCCVVLEQNYEVAAKGLDCLVPSTV